MDSKSQRQLVRKNISVVVMLFTLIGMVMIGAALWLIL